MSRKFTSAVDTIDGTTDQELDDVIVPDDAAELDTTDEPTDADSDTDTDTDGAELDTSTDPDEPTTTPAQRRDAATAAWNLRVVEITIDDTAGPTDDELVSVFRPSGVGSKHLDACYAASSADVMANVTDDLELVRIIRGVAAVRDTIAAALAVKASKPAGTVTDPRADAIALAQRHHAVTVMVRDLLAAVTAAEASVAVIDATEEELARINDVSAVDGSKLFPAIARIEAFAANVGRTRSGSGATAGQPFADGETRWHASGASLTYDGAEYRLDGNGYTLTDADGAVVGKFKSASAAAKHAAGGTSVNGLKYFNRTEVPS